MAAAGTSMVGRWEPWYRTGRRFAHAYGPEDTYRLAEEWLSGISVEDWGCGYAHFRDGHSGPYRGVDGSGAWADELRDLRQRPRGDRPQGILLRHVLEHNPDWRVVLAHATAHFEERMVLVVFTPDSGSLEARALGAVAELGVVDLALPHRVLDFAFEGCRIVDKCHVATATGYAGETVWRVER